MADDTQDEPLMDVDNADVTDQVAGIVVQTRADVGKESEERIREVLAQRLADAEITLDEAEIADLAHQVAKGETLD